MACKFFLQVHHHNVFHFEEDEHYNVRDKLIDLLKKLDITEEVCGMAKGADMFGSMVAHCMNVKVIDFYADWCGPCKMLSPHLDALAKQYAGKIDIFKVDVDKEKTLGQAFGAYSIPLIIFVPKNGEPQSHRGYMDKASLEKAIEDVLLKSSK